MKKKWKWISGAAAVVFLMILIYLFQGPLFPWNPIKPGYEKIKFSRGMLYIKDITGKDSIVFRIDKIIEAEEKFHDLRYQDDMKIFIVNRDGSMKRFLPWMGGAGYSVSLSMANLIYIGPKARNSKAGPGPHIKHELSHMLIDQNTSLENALEMHEQGWFVEGIAEYFSGHTFYSREEFKEVCRRYKFEFDGLMEKNPLKMKGKELLFSYSYYKYFIEYLCITNGEQKLRQYLKRYIQKPGEYKELFREIYGTDLKNLLTGYKKFLNL